MKTPRQAWAAHKSSARQRGIDFNFSFEEWVQWWLDALGPDWMEKRGTHRGGYCMARHGDRGPYEAGNVRCATNGENAREVAPAPVVTDEIARFVFRSGWKEEIIQQRTGLSMRVIRAIRARQRWKHATADMIPAWVNPAHAATPAV